MKKVIIAIRNMFKALWCWILYMGLPRRSKRTFFITTVYLNMKNLHEFRQETLSRLNDALGIAKDDDALKLPALLYQLGLVGHSHPLDQYSTAVVEHQSEEAYLREVCAAVLKVTPKWMLYGRRTDMFEDLFRVFKLLPEPAV